MSRKLAKGKTPQHHIGREELAAGLRKTLEGKYGKVLEATRRKWEREFGAIKDPSDAIVDVRVSGAPRKRRAIPGKRKRDK